MPKQMTVLKALPRRGGHDPAKGLACAVLAKAIEDLLQVPNTHDRERARDDACRFLLKPNLDLELWVEAADLDMEAVVSRSESAYERFIEDNDG